MIGQILAVAAILVVVSAVIVAVATFGVMGLVNGASNGLQRAAERVLYGPKGSGKTQIAALPKPDYKAIVAMEEELGFEPLPVHQRMAAAQDPHTEAVTEARIKRQDLHTEAVVWKVKTVVQTHEQWEEGCVDPDCPNWETVNIEHFAGGVQTFHQHIPHPPRSLVREASFAKGKVLPKPSFSPGDLL